MVQTIAPSIVQSGEGNTTFKEYVEQTIAKMHAPPQAQLVERARIVALGIPIQTRLSDYLR